MYDSTLAASDMNNINFFKITYLIFQPGGRLNKKDGLTRYGDSHVKDKTS